MKIQENKYYIRFLPSGNASEFPLIERNLKAFGIEYEEKYKEERGSRIYRIKGNELKKLPHDKHGPYLPVTADSSHSLYIEDKLWREYEGIIARYRKTKEKGG
jgi:hypothetical protein